MEIGERKIIEVTVQDGVVEVAGVPEGVIVRVKDYDCEGSEPENLLDDGSGRLCILSEYGAESEVSRG